MKRKYIIIGIILAVLFACPWFVYYFFFDYDHYTISGDYKTLKIRDTTYVYSSMADQTTTQLKRHAIGETQNGDSVCELDNDPAHNSLVLIQNTEMPPWELFKKKQ